MGMAVCEYVCVNDCVCECVSVWMCVRSEMIILSSSPPQDMRIGPTDLQRLCRCYAVAIVICGAQKSFSCVGRAEHLTLYADEARGATSTHR